MAIDKIEHTLDIVLDALRENGLSGAAEAHRIVVNEAAKIEREEYLGTKRYERSENRKNYANGYNPKTVLTRLGQITFDVPEVREGGFYPSEFNKGSRTEQAVNIASAEMYVQGGSVRRVTETDKAEVHHLPKTSIQMWQTKHPKLAGVG